MSLSCRKLEKKHKSRKMEALLNDIIWGPKQHLASMASCVRVPETSFSKLGDLCHSNTRSKNYDHNTKCVQNISNRT